MSWEQELDRLAQDLLLNIQDTNGDLATVADAYDNPSAAEILRIGASRVHVIRELLWVEAKRVGIVDAAPDVADVIRAVKEYANQITEV